MNTCAALDSKYVHAITSTSGAEGASFMICFQLMVPLLAYTLIFFSFVYLFEMLLGSLYKALDFQAAALEAKMLSSLSV